VITHHNKSLHETKPLVTHRAYARSAPTVFAGETNVGRIGGRVDCALSALVTKTINQYILVDGVKKGI
jgi:hypothetical protein